MSDMLVEIFVRIERSHASGSGGGDGLTIHVIGDVASGEDPGHAGGRCRAVAAALDDDVAVAHLELAREDAGVRRMTDGDERARGLDVLDRAAVLRGLDAHAVHAGIVADDLVDGVVPHDTDLARLLEGEQAILQDLLRAELVAPVDHRHVAREVR
jgi:hypothetical protein